MTPQQIAQKYLELKLQYEEISHVECGFKKATQQEEDRLKRIASGIITSKDYKQLAPLFAAAGIELKEYLQIREARQRFSLFGALKK
ncbi:hypothetical protein [Thaumasiovibrio subtropicus]|uniref:hypothetical protein n=1 Tax=Thaumasiovibrio subtropicus TaxID=1891207 RepID=UPI000B355D14|nr:hypothetical protein [Thaumasiovibrio subtropicus]